MIIFSLSFSYKLALPFFVINLKLISRLFLLNINSIIFFESANKKKLIKFFLIKIKNIYMKNNILLSTNIRLIDKK